MSKLRMTLGCWNYDRTRALMDGSVQPDGIEHGDEHSSEHGHGFGH